MRWFSDNNVWSSSPSWPRKASMAGWLSGSSICALTPAAYGTIYNVGDELLGCFSIRPMIGCMPYVEALWKGITGMTSWGISCVQYLCRKNSTAHGNCKSRNDLPFVAKSSNLYSTLTSFLFHTVQELAGTTLRPVWSQFIINWGGTCWHVLSVQSQSGRIFELARILPHQAVTWT